MLTAMKHYGLIVADNGSNWFFQGTMDAGWDSGPYPAMVSQLKTIPASAFEAVDESALMADPNSGRVLIPVRAPAAQSTAPPIAGRGAANPSPSGLGGPRRPQIFGRMAFRPS